ncbi:DUF6355 family natural product biosynthesis protein [Lentzea sp. NBRC 102530]|uniref:DUF6355 family natural product biosynthesis protein n=1 Tax=Lentzea sp. NBRC 102530 TaxID=3032201 RepID=UPI0024A0154A|nr:DUF6355 family natural product biosynthesis protein [Lentzea sp. NBRC 102530]GLY52457.1 hypothetical protein Lesp01_61130 [Lentzea sp. NBRC 102530]
MKTSLRKSFAVLSSAAVAAGLLLVGGTSAQAMACGYQVEGTPATQTVYYHCDGSSKVWIHVDFISHADIELCVGPGRTELGNVFIVQNAWYAGALCNTVGDIRDPR